MSAVRLFAVLPDRICEHPPELGGVPGRIAEGPVEGWECYAAPASQGDPNLVIGPFTAVIRKENNNLYIEVSEHRQKIPYWFQEASSTPWGDRPPCWYQSGCTLRFITKR